VATALLLDPHFEHTVVLLLDVDENGALGVVLNRPSPVPVSDVDRAKAFYTAKIGFPRGY
jgi:putative transcriptional regulator